MPTTITATVTVQNGASLGARDVTAVTGGETATLPNGFTVTTVGPATHLLVLPHSFTTSGVPVQFTVTALDASDNPVVNYPGTVHFTSSDPSAILPPNSTLVNGDWDVFGGARHAGCANDYRLGCLVGRRSAEPARASPSRRPLGYGSSP